LTPAFFAAADPQVSFDEAHVLFSGQKTAGHHWQVWEINADGSAPRQVTRCRMDCLRAAYLPDDEIVYTAEETQGGRPGLRLEVCKRDGSGAHAITFGPGDFQVETVLCSGMILASASWPLAPGKVPGDTRQFYTLRPDGTALESFRCEHQQAVIRAQARELEDGSLVFVKSARTDERAGGRLAEIRPGATHNVPLGPVTELSWPSAAWGRSKLIVSRWIPADPGGAGRFDLYILDLETSAFGERIYGEPGVSSIQAVPVASRSVPKRFWSLVNPEAKAGHFICLNGYRSADDPQGHFSTPIAAVRVLALDPTAGQEQVLGDAPVEKDGSFFVAVPADEPVRFELLDAHGETIHEQRSWVWTRPGEERGCPGCHENKALAPENRWPLALKRFDTPTLLGVKDHATSRP
jgi:hypothetical protein